MRAISVKDLEDNAEQLLREVGREEESYLVKTGDGPVAFLTPLGVSEEEVEHRTRPYEPSWEGYAELADRLRETWPEGRQARTVLDDVRR